MTTTSKSKTFRPRTVRTSGNAPAERHEALRRTPSLGFLLPKQINFMATYSKELAQKALIEAYKEVKAEQDSIIHSYRLKEMYEVTEKIKML